MTRLLQIFYGLRKKDSLNFAIFAELIERGEGKFEYNNNE